MRWYKKDGTLYTDLIKQKNGKLRDANVRDARELGLAPSVTSIIDVLAKPGLVRWKEGKLIGGSWSFTDDYIFYHGGKPPLDLVKDYVYEEYKQEMEKVTGFGTDVHRYVEHWLTTGEKLKPKPENKVSPFLDPLYTFLEKNAIKGTSEKSFYNKIEDKGYAGTKDLEDDVYVTDFKTQDTKGTGKFVYYPESLWQGAAYVYGTDKKFRNIYISSTEPGLFKIKEYKPEEVAKAGRIFACLLGTFYEIKGL